MAKSSREWVLCFLLEVNENQKHSDTVLHQIFKENDLPSRDRSFIKKISYGVLEQRIYLDGVLNHFSKVKVKKMKPVIRNVLRMGVYELLFMESIPAQATCNECVKLASKRGLSGLKGFVNGILRNIDRHREDYSPTNLSEKYSMPQWLVDHLNNQYKEETEMILKGLLRQRPVTLRVIPSRCSVETLTEQYQAQGLTVTKGTYFDDMISLTGSFVVNELYGFEEGYFAIQDESSTLPVRVSQLQEGMTVVDLCAAPGGKTMHAAQEVGNKGIVIASDVTAYKCNKLNENAKRLGYDNIQVVCQDAREYREELSKKADVVLADVPCSGIGIIGRKPDIKYHISPESLQGLVDLQKEILQTGVNYCKPGGLLIYSTCTINRHENQEMVQWIVENYDFELESIDEDLPQSLRSDETQNGMLQILPGIHESDGFFVAKMRRKAE